ncbi:LLM class flavin-dependent oxidoreductase [Streptomyces sp. NPDC001978]|uniref:LLM class flavin-dependent oxidoreductase n=1 Tax=Streptomyces sp. NPDC001978 TaxID=3364627 RepID=UPI003676CE8B
MTDTQTPRISVLDHSPVSSGAPLTAPLTAALQHSTALARLAEERGYLRYWVAEHHGRPWMAGSTPATLMAHVAASTTTIRVGSGALLLSNYAPLSVVEQFGMLEALHPGRIDLGLGRAAGGDAIAAHALRRTADDFDSSLAELLAFFQGSFPPEHPYGQVRATPGQGSMPAVWLLGSGTHSARLAGRLGLPYAHGGHFAAASTEEALSSYRAAFRPSAALAAPYVLVSVGVICADTDEAAERINETAARNMIRGLSGVGDAFLSAAELDAAERENAASGDNRTATGGRNAPTDGEAMYVRDVLASHVVGSPKTVRAGLLRLAARWGADELMITTLMHDYQARLRSYELVADAMATS